MVLGLLGSVAMLRFTGDKAKVQAVMRPLANS